METYSHVVGRLTGGNILHVERRSGSYCWELFHDTLLIDWPPGPLPRINDSSKSSSRSSGTWRVRCAFTRALWFNFFVS